MHRFPLAALALVSTASTLLAQDSTFIRFANVGQSYSAAIFAGDSRIGRHVVSANVTLHLTVNAGSDAAAFVSDLLLPVDTGATIVINGTEQHWSGSGTFDLNYTTTDFNGVIIARRYGAETFGVQGSITSDSGITLFFSPICAADFNHDAVVDFFDYLDFAQALGAQDPSADFNADGVVDLFDYLDFLLAFDTAC